MINISNTLKQACNGDNLTYREYVVLDGTTTQIDVAVEMYASAYKDTHFIGSFNMKYIKFTTSNDVQYRNKELTFYKEVNGEAFKVGNFIVTEIKDNDSNEEVNVTAYDYGLKFAQPYQTSLDYSTGNITLKDVLDEICDNVGVQLVNTTITNGDFIVDSNQFVNGEMYGDVISAIAFISGDFATINDEDKLQFIFNTPTDEIIEDYINLDDKRDTRPITSLSIGTSAVEGQNAVIKDQALIDQYGEHWLEINDVPFAYTLEKREQLKQAIFDKVKGFGYSSFKSEYAFKPYYSLGDLIQFRNKEGQLINSIILRFTSKYDNIILEAPSVTDATIEYENPKTAYDVAKRAEVIANQSTAEITNITTSTDLLEERVSAVETKQTTTDYKISVLSTNIDAETGQVKSVETETGFTFDESGLHIQKGTSLNTLIDDTGTYYKNGDTILSQTTKDGTITKDMVLYGKYYYGVDEDLDVASFTKDDAMFVAEKYTDNNGEVGFGHFYNGGDL